MDPFSTLEDLVAEFTPDISQPVTYKSLYNDYLATHLRPRQDLAHYMKQWSHSYPDDELVIYPEMGQQTFDEIHIRRTGPRKLKYIDIIRAFHDVYKRGNLGDVKFLMGLEYQGMGVWIAGMEMDG